MGILVVTFVVGYIFSGMLSARRSYSGFPTYGFDFEDLKFSILISAPAIILHELGHKFVALAFGIPAVFHVYWSGLVLAVILKLIGSPFLILAPAYVVTPAEVSALARFLISFAGPGVNLLLWGVSSLMLRKKRMKPLYHLGFALSKRINLFLFIFNMIPIPPLDGFNVFRSLFALITSSF